MLRRLVARLLFAFSLSAKTFRWIAKWLGTFCGVVMQTGSLAELCRCHWFQIQSSDCEIIWFVCMWQESSVECGAGFEKSVISSWLSSFLQLPSGLWFFLRSFLGMVLALWLSGWQWATFLLPLQWKSLESCPRYLAGPLLLDSGVHSLPHTWMF